MSVLDRRVQILLDPAQYEELEREAGLTGLSVAAVIRQAITARLSRRDFTRMAAAQRLIQSADSDDERGDEWNDTKAALTQSLASKVH